MGARRRRRRRQRRRQPRQKTPRRSPEGARRNLGQDPSRSAKAEAEVKEEKGRGPNPNQSRVQRSALLAACVRIRSRRKDALPGSKQSKQGKRENAVLVVRLRPSERRSVEWKKLRRRYALGGKYYFLIHDISDFHFNYDIFFFKDCFLRASTEFTF